jgi:transcription antitermination factor NusG
MLMGRETAGDWFILRTAGRSTLPLASSLAEDGFEVWTPVRTMRVRVRQTKQTKDVRAPMLASFIFVKADHLHEMLALSKLKLKPRRNVQPIKRGEPNEPRYHRDFTVFRAFGEIPFVTDAALKPMRVKELEAIPKKDAPQFNRGARVRAHGSAFEGLKGKVERCKSGYALVIFDDWKRPAKIPTFLLREVDIPSAHHQSARAA